MFWRQQHHAEIIAARTTGRGGAGRDERDRKEEAAAKMAERLRNLLVAESEERWQDGQRQNLSECCANLTAQLEQFKEEMNDELRKLQDAAEEPVRQRGI